MLRSNLKSGWENPERLTSNTDLYTEITDHFVLFTRSEVEQHYQPLTRGECCAEWLILRRFRVTATLSSKVYLHDELIREKRNISSEVQY